MNDIILTGPKHCGKTNAGKTFASLYSCDFIDLDELVFQRTGKSPRQLYIESPEVFQKNEAQAVSTFFNLKSQNKRIIATGGGIIDNHEAIEVIKNSGALILYLKISAETAWQRISAQEELPPFLQTENPQETHRVLHERRSAAYLQLANIVIDVDGKTSNEIAEKIFENCVVP